MTKCAVSGTRQATGTKTITKNPTSTSDGATRQFPAVQSHADCIAHHEAVSSRGHSYVCWSTGLLLHHLSASSQESNFICEFQVANSVDLATPEALARTGTSALIYIYIGKAVSNVHSVARASWILLSPFYGKS
jgi:hypothetical protein